jgi:diguanylate cyclase (GGDEF)-like protein/PAS domain S-box-containing protein
MVAEAVPPDRRSPDAARATDRLAQQWARALTDSSFVSMDRAALVGLLRALLTDLLGALTAATFDRTVALRVGAALVDAHFTEAGSIERTLALLGEELPGVAGTEPGGKRLALLVGAVAAGFASALQERTRGEQERVSAAAFAAHSAAEQARWDSETRFRAVFAESVIGIGVADTAGRILEVNRAMSDMLGYSESALRAGTIWSFVHPDDVPGLWDRTRELLAGARNHLRVEKVYYRADGSEVWTDLVLSLVRDPQGNPRYMVAMAENITERHRLQVRLQHLALHDPLTGLPNRTLFFGRLDAALRADRAPGVCYLDLDGFKAVNDTLGHDRGDTLLQTVARRLTAALGDDHLVARMGGDEFVVLVHADADGQRLRRVAHTALEAVRTPVRLGGTEIAVTASVGVVQADGGRDTGELMKAADTTLYWAKADGGDRYAVFDKERHRRDVDRFELSSRMPEALARGEFGLEYQPLVRLTDRRMIGVEALVRWTLPDGRRLDPTTFVPLAEDTGFIVRLGRWVLEQACRQAAQWVAADPASQLLLSVNLAARQVREPEIVDDVAATLAATGWPPEQLQLELTESALMGTNGESLAALRALADMGVRIAIDDFGTGYSNLAYLRRLPVHALKLAGSFVTGSFVTGSFVTGAVRDVPDLDADAGRPERVRGADGGRRGLLGGDTDVDREVVGLLIRLAHTLDLTVTAESVETAAQFAHLQQLGCDTGQGWFFAPAMPAEAVPALVGRALGTG